MAVRAGWQSLLRFGLPSESLIAVVAVPWGDGAETAVGRVDAGLLW